MQNNSGFYRIYLNPYFDDRLSIVGPGEYFETRYLDSPYFKDGHNKDIEFRTEQEAIQWLKIHIKNEMISPVILNKINEFNDHHKYYK